MVSVGIGLGEHQGSVGKNAWLTFVRVSDGGRSKPAFDVAILGNVGLCSIAKGLAVMEFDSIILFRLRDEHRTITDIFCRT